MRPRLGALSPGQPMNVVEKAIEKADATPQPTPQPSGETISTIGSQMTIAGRIVCEAAARIFGRIEGELHGASVMIGVGARVRGALTGADLMIDEGAQVEGDIRAHNVMVRGDFKGTIRAAEVKLLGYAAVEGDIFHQRLSMEETTQFEGSSRVLSGE